VSAATAKPMNRIGALLPVAVPKLPPTLFGRVVVVRFSQFVFGTQPIVELSSLLAPSFLEQFVGTVSEDLRLDGARSASPQRLGMFVVFLCVAMLLLSS